MENVKKLTAIAVAVSAAMPLLANADVMITEYVEGSSDRKSVV